MYTLTDRIDRERDGEWLNIRPRRRVPIDDDPTEPPDDGESEEDDE